MASDASVQLARDIRRELATEALTPSQAKLYSQRLRKDMNREGLVSFRDSHIAEYLDEAILLLQCALIERDWGEGTAWQSGVKRAAQLLEWLAQPSLRPAGAPLHLLAAASYQLAEYPAMALGLLRTMPTSEPFSLLLRDFLRADFPAALSATQAYWRYDRSRSSALNGQFEELTAASLRQVVMCIGTICAHLRTGDADMVGRAVTKLELLANGFLHSRDSYSYLLAQLTAAASRRFVETSLWSQIAQLRAVSSDAAITALTQFARSAFTNKRILAWPSQRVGIERLRRPGSFVLCTPTGSGKTMIATLAAVQALFSETARVPTVHLEVLRGNLVLYLVPSRALAAEVEHRLSQDLRGLAADPVVVTGLYGGVDWGPTDAWIQADRATVLVCTFEKADALLRYLGVFFLDRVQLVVIDEAHGVDHDRGGWEPRDGAPRSLHLEQLGARLLRARDQYHFRLIALSAVAARAAPALARWVAASNDATPIASTYRSTRQMLGRLEVAAGGQLSIHYDLMDGRSLTFDDERQGESPFVRGALSHLPAGIDTSDGPEVRMRAPTLWAALQLAATRPDGSKPSVLISLTQNVNTFAAACADLMARWANESLPDYQSIDEDDEQWQRCLASAADYFTTESVEYRLLERGIAVHHGKMPGLMARRLKGVIDSGRVRVVIATSTLSEGVNIPVSYLLIPSVYRGATPLSPQEFNNLVGRAGRPGVATEGSALVVLEERAQVRGSRGRISFRTNRQWDAYQSLVASIELSSRVAAGSDAPEDDASSPLAQLLSSLQAAWSSIARSNDVNAFSEWLEETSIADDPELENAAIGYLDSLDSFLIAAIQEVEELRGSELDNADLERELVAIWRRTYAFAATQAEARLEAIWLTRGKVIKVRYPDSGQRRRIYKTSLSPRSANALIGLQEALRSHLQSGAEYALWDVETRYAFVRDVIELLTGVPSFRIEEKLGRKKNYRDWPRILRWWLAKNTLDKQPAAKDVTAWFEFVSKNFVYRASWGVGSILGLVLDGEGEQSPIKALEISDWPRSGLPWIAFWLKELLAWGTLDPVAAYLLARGGAVDRPGAEQEARRYYEQADTADEPNALLDPRTIRAWLDARTPEVTVVRETRTLRVDAVLSNAATDYARNRLTVAPLETEEGFIWIDPAGYVVARSARRADWPTPISDFVFELSVTDSSIHGMTYQEHL